MLSLVQLYLMGIVPGSVGGGSANALTHIGRIFTRAPWRVLLWWGGVGRVAKESVCLTNRYRTG